MAELVKCLLHEHKDLGYVPRTNLKMAGMFTCACNRPVLGRWTQRNLWKLLARQYKLMRECWVKERPCPKEDGWSSCE